MAIGREQLSNFLATLRGFARGLWKPGGSVAQKTIRGATWGLAGNAGIKLFGILQVAILTRLLAPRDFGVMRLAMVVVGLSATLSNFGVSAALVQRKEVSREVLDTAWVMDMIRNIFVFLAIWVLSGPVAAYYHEPILASLVKVISLKFLLTAFRNVGIMLLYRDMDFRRTQIYEVSLDMAGNLATLGFAVWLRSVWALALGQVILGLGELVGSYIINPYRPRFRFDLAEARSLFRFGKHIFLGGLLDFPRNQLDIILVGRLAGMNTLGIYSIAKSLITIPSWVFSSMFSNILYPAFSRIQHDVDILRRGYLRSMGVGCLTMCPALVGIALTAVPLVHILYPKEYGDSALYASALALAELFGFLTVIGKSALQARGRPGLNNLTSIASIVALAALSWLLAGICGYGVMGVIAALTLAKLAEWTLTTVWLRWEIALPLPALALTIGRPLAASIAMGLGVRAIGALVPMRPAVSLPLLVASGVVLYLATSSLFNRAGCADAWSAVAGASKP